ncbi:TetR family transcriptional regulator [Niallia taxi]|uniref:TetR/AcrR family transcriptional regulator n=1 Tax=Niallia taxi TaxID=2499688 RepID=A0A437KER2_9BACI|nr:TetR family transcriptional regulator [Niallia taxi]MDK8641765.1 TetR family transcriptional regulator [Niallia taxi]MED4038520.1 TetR family transcriptional regulator [Niallia taxi]MED4056687.1 TetR family transcriptional regulator [Niallia taxi]MED4117398.1 TetR family transcriptional regulator [Niallia taxi]RVT65555.1 TetR/AcrR family transcriptional regulator [Niallia taxi]
MPKQTFFHLAQDKQDTLILAAKEEFSRVPLHEASIANIIKSAGIPRGSFYQYFDDKEDLYFYLLSETSKKNTGKFLLILQENNGDLFKTFIESFRFMVSTHKDKDQANFFKNAFLNMNYKLENTLANNVYEENQKSHFENISKSIDKSMLNIEDESELHHMVRVMTAVTFHNLVQMFVKDLTAKEAENSYLMQMKLLKRGFCKTEC